jgi:hypothetical protein
LAPGLTPLVALIAVWVAYRQLKLNRRSQRETTAKATFREYLKLAFEHPDLAEGDYQRLVQAGKADKHSWFVGYFLWAAEEILEYAPRNRQRRKNLQMQADKHRAYFEENEVFNKVEKGTYSRRTRKLIERAIQSGKK